MFNLFSPAKLNLSLEVNNLLDNGLHNLTSIMHTLDLHDEISISYSQKNKTTFKPAIVESSNNSILDAIYLFQQEFGSNDQFEIITTKNIPISSGLGGGSSNSTTILKGLIEVNKLEADVAKLRELSLTLSSDSPFFVSGGCSLVEGQGQQISTGLGLKNLWAVIFIPLNRGVINKTKFMYSLLSENHYTDGSIDLAHLSADSVNGTKIADDSINSEHYVDGSIDTAHIADSQVTLAKLASNSVNSSSLSL